MKKIFPQTVKAKKVTLNPISGDEVCEVVKSKYLEPKSGILKFRVKNVIKKISKRGVLTPSLYYDKKMHFAFFPRQDDKWLNNYYNKQGIVDAENFSSRLNFFNSPAIANAADVMLDFSEMSDDLNVYIDYGAGSCWMAKAIKERTNGIVKAVDFSTDSMRHIKETSVAIEPVELCDFLEPEQPKFDFLGCVDTFEHLNDPLSALKQIYNKANDGASVFLSVPNFDSYFSRINLGIHPYYAFPPHLNYFTSLALKQFSELAGFKVSKQAVVTLPWEIEYISRPYTRRMAPITGWELSDTLNNGKDGERLFILLKK